MNIIDLLLVIIVLLSAWAGWRRGFIIGSLDLIGWIGSVVVALLFYRPVAGFIERNIALLGVWSLPVAFLAVMLITRILFSIITNRFLRMVHPQTHGHGLNKTFGLVPGVINGLINATIIAALLLAIPISDGVTNKTRDSVVASKLAVQVEWLDEQLSPVFDEAISRSINKLTVKPESNTSVSLPFKVSSPRVREDLEAKMLELVNEERAKEGLHPLKADPELAVVARKHSADMFARGYFAHISPEGKSAGDRIRAAGARFLVAGENLALGQTLSICHQGLMNSPGHKANILHKSYGRLGIGILDGGIYGLMITQNFRN
ncbi:MAG TPA: CvpA family protein [Chitinophagaceae bacterium]|nr:CvpA family protein [Chitinophagaceae bacterium]